MTKAKLILLNGFMASGKTTIGKKYIADHSLAMSIEADSIVDNIGDWAQNREEVRGLVFELSKAMARAYLQSGHDVVLPYMVLDAEEARDFEIIAHDSNANFYEIVLHNNQSDAIDRLVSRGKLGMASSPKITDDDLPMFEADFVKMETALSNRPGAIKIKLTGVDPDQTYQQLLQLVKN